MEADRPPGALLDALLQFHRSVGPIFKASQAKYGKFADLSTVLETVTPPLLEAGLVLIQTMEPDPAQGCLILRTQLRHGPSGEEISSSMALPDLALLLERLHQTRMALLEHYPVDLPLAALGAVPLTLPRAAAAADGLAPAGPPPAATPREPGLRLDEQLRGLQGYGAALGLNSNPLHSLGGAITYWRRYQILALLCLATEDPDGQEPGRHERAVAMPEPLPPPPAAVGTRRRRAAAPAPVPPAPEPSAPEPEPAPAPKPAPVEPPVVSPEAQLTPAEIQQLIAEIRTLGSTAVTELVNQFRSHYQLPATVMISDYLTNREHLAFCRTFIARQQPAATAA
jgi:hypothetical protein